MTKRISIATFALLAAFSAAPAQETAVADSTRETAERESTPWSVTAAAGLNIRRYSGGVDLGAHPEIAAENCGLLESGRADAPSFGGGIEYAITPSLQIGLRSLIENASGEVRTPAPGATRFRRSDGTLVDLVSDYVMPVEAKGIAAELYASLLPLDFPLVVSAGPKIHLMSGGEYRLREEIISPGDAAFENGTGIRPFGEGTFAGRMRIGGMLGLGYRLPLLPFVEIVPEVVGYLFPASVVEFGSLREFSVRGGASVRYTFPVPLPPPPPPPPPPPAPFVPALEASVRAAGISQDSIEGKELVVQYDRKVVRRETVFLPYIFFESNSAAIPSRYQRYEQPSEDALWRYRRILFLLGRRMQSMENESITLIGSTSGNEEDGGALGKRRAETVRRYLVDSFDIAPSRIRIEGRSLPRQQSNNTIEEGREENRRVEIQGSARMLAPIVTTDTVRAFASNGIAYYATASSDTGLFSWTLVVTLNRQQIRELRGYGPPPRRIVDPLTSAELATVVRDGAAVGYSISVVDSSLTERTTGLLTIPARIDTLTYDDTLARTGPAIAGEAIFFEYNSAQIRPEGRGAIERLKRQIPANARLAISGFADETGDTTRNRQLSLERASAVAALFPEFHTTIEAMGSSMVLFPNDTPEGRYLSRAARILIVPAAASTP